MQSNRPGVQPRRRTQHYGVTSAPPPRKRKKKRFSLIKTLLMLIGLGTVFVFLMRYVIVPALVMLPRWIGG